MYKLRKCFRLIMHCDHKVATKLTFGSTKPLEFLIKKYKMEVKEICCHQRLSCKV